MADQHIGYPGSVNSAQLATWIPNVGTAQYHVEGLEDGRVITNGVGDRGITVKKGTIIGDGIVDIFENDVNLNLASVASGSPDRWDMIVLRRTWNATPGASTSVYTIIQGGPNRTLPARNNSKGVLADQPMALCRVRAGQTTVQEIVDLRCWAHNAGMSALDKLVMSYVDQLGSRIDFQGELWQLMPYQEGTVISSRWEQMSKLDHVQLGAIGSVLDGTTPTDMPFSIQAGSTVTSSDGSGYARLNFGFPNGLLTVLVFNGDGWAAPDTHYTGAGGGSRWGSQGTGTKATFVYAVWGPNGLRTDFLHRANYIAIGW